MSNDTVKPTNINVILEKGLNSAPIIQPPFVMIGDVKTPNINTKVIVKNSEPTSTPPPNEKRKK